MAAKKKASFKKGKSSKAAKRVKANKPAKKKSKKLTATPRRRERELPNATARMGAAPTIQGPGARSGGQSGDTEGLSDAELGDFESVEELVEEGQDFEAELVDAVENAPDPDRGELEAEVPEENDQDSDSGSFTRRNRL